MKKLTIEEKIILQIALANFVQSRQDAKENSYIPVEYLNRDIKIAQDLQEHITNDEIVKYANDVWGNVNMSDW